MATLAHKIRLDPNESQKVLFDKAIGCSRFTYNWICSRVEEVKRETGKFSSISELKKEFNRIKGKEFPWIYDSPKDANQQPFANFQNVMNKFFRKTGGFPHGHKKGIHDSFYISNGKFKVVGNRVKIQKIGSIRMTEELRLKGKILSATVSKHAGKYYISISVDGDFYRTPTKRDEIGIDLGVKTALVTSGGEYIQSPNPLKKNLRKLRREQRKLTRQKKGSNRRQKQKMKLQRIHDRISCIRNDFLHKVSNRVCRENQTIVLEDLNVRGMQKFNRGIARAISDVGFGEFGRQVQYKSVLYGDMLVWADRFFPSSKRCSGCGSIKEMPLGIRTYDCPICGMIKDRDLNSAICLKQYPRVVGNSSSWTSMEKDEARTLTREDFLS